jgi:hypothetical protein
MDPVKERHILNHPNPDDYYRTYEDPPPKQTTRQSWLPTAALVLLLVSPFVFAALTGAHQRLIPVPLTQIQRQVDDLRDENGELRKKLQAFEGRVKFMERAVRECNSIRQYEDLYMIERTWGVPSEESESQ